MKTKYVHLPERVVINKVRAIGTTCLDLHFTIYCSWGKCDSLKSVDIVQRSNSRTYLVQKP
jgi:hypothetical protein